MKLNSKTSYIWWRDKKMQGTILLIVFSSLQIFAWLQLPFLTTIHSYTIGMLFGFYNPFFYIFVIYISLKMIFGKKIKFPKWLKINKFTYWSLFLIIIFFGFSLTIYQNKDNFKLSGRKILSLFSNWFNNFTNSKNAWVPNKMDGGIIGTFFYSLIAMIISNIGAFILSILLLSTIIFYIIINSSIRFNKYKKNSIIKNNKTIISKKNNDKNVPKKITIENIDKKTLKNMDFFPFDDPFE